MKLLGYKRVKGEKNGNQYDFVQLYVEESFISSNADGGGSQIFQIRRNGYYAFPTCTPTKFLEALQKGLKIGSVIDLTISGDIIIQS